MNSNGIDKTKDRGKNKDIILFWRFLRELSMRIPSEDVKWELKHLPLDEVSFRDNRIIHLTRKIIVKVI